MSTGFNFGLINSNFQERREGRRDGKEERKGKETVLPLFLSLVLCPDNGQLGVRRLNQK